MVLLEQRGKLCIQLHATGLLLLRISLCLHRLVLLLLKVELGETCRGTSTSVKLWFLYGLGWADCNLTRHSRRFGGIKGSVVNRVLLSERLKHVKRVLSIAIILSTGTGISQRWVSCHVCCVIE